MNKNNGTITLMYVDEKTGEEKRIRLNRSSMGEPILPRDRLRIANSILGYEIKGYALSGAAYLQVTS